ncbi:hypothetical protein [Desulforamulus hydrothermalis]|uniref:Phage related protein n=1 Tax=Desulforamulus hydrothermalis Lam5 = DSM 18033 TaxID=1121428 RepID=K8EI28_9FIRM|nr:hypothetical protein [Desulforamulus hydrothermalis]CCO08276.1 Phage related protein [Desulforamulus hydrothermalis Lam5 = DSM 18033]SHH37458.1 hypothetical protein SAMN02745177_02340 [Desulforamulus hydrothermalis Lam5 = DSM 18033]
MRELNIGGQVVRVRATPLALLYYRQEFGTALLSDMAKIKTGISGFDHVLCLQIIWAMAKAENGPGKQFPSFETWLSSFDEINLFDTTFVTAALEEAARGFLGTKSSQE